MVKSEGPSAYPNRSSYTSKPLSSPNRLSSGEAPTNAPVANPSARSMAASVRLSSGNLYPALSWIPCSKG